MARSTCNYSCIHYNKDISTVAVASGLPTLCSHTSWHLLETTMCNWYCTHRWALLRMLLMPSKLILNIYLYLAESIDNNRSIRYLAMCSSLPISNSTAALRCILHHWSSLTQFMWVESHCKTFLMDMWKLKTICKHQRIENCNKGWMNIYRVSLTTCCTVYSAVVLSEKGVCLPLVPPLN